MTAATSATAPLRPPDERGAPPRVLLRRLALRDFRNLARADLELPDDGIALVGENGHGKTNLLEAIYYLQLLRSMRGARDQDLVRFGAAGFHVAAVADGERRHEIAVGFERASRRKKAVLDGGEPPRLSDALGALPSVIFSPGDVQLVAGAPSERRRYLDVMLALTSRRYLAALQHYRAALARRNAALRDVARGGQSDARVAVWEPPLAQHGATIWSARRAWVAAHADRFTALCSAIGERGAAAIGYVTSLDAPDDSAGAEQALLAALERRRRVDILRGMTHAGPHRDDLALTITGPDDAPRDLRTFGSAGQQRTAAIALRMLEAATLRDRTGSAPLFLLDDPFAELDANRARRILALLGDAGLGQILLTVPRASDIPAELTRLARWTIRDGEVGQ